MRKLSHQSALLFPSETFHMINRCDPDIATWSESGDNFVVKNLEKFASVRGSICMVLLCCERDILFLTSPFCILSVDLKSVLPQYFKVSRVLGLVCIAGNALLPWRQHIFRISFSAYSNEFLQIQLHELNSTRTFHPLPASLTFMAFES